MKNETRILFFCHMGHFLAHFSMLTYPTLVFSISDTFGYSLMQTLNIAFWMYLLFGLVSLPMGYLNDRLGNSKLFLVFFFLGTGLSYLLIAAAKAVWMLKASLMLLGIVSSIYHPVGMSLISKVIPQRGKALGLNGIFGTLGIAMAPFAGGCLAYYLGWRGAYWLLAAVPFGLGMWLVFVKFVETPLPAVKERTSYGRAAWGHVLWLILAAAFFVGLIYRAAVSVAPVYLKTYAKELYEWFVRWNDVKAHEAFREMLASMVVTGIYLFGIIGQVFGGYLADRVDLKKAYFYFHLMALPLLVLMVWTSDVVLVMAFVGYVFFTIGMQPIENSLIASISPVSMRGMIYGMKFVFILGSSALAVKGVVWVEDVFELRWVFGLSVIYLLCTLALLGLMLYVARSQRP